MEQFIINKNKEEFLNIARENIKREGIEELLKWIESTDFFEAPASAKFHLAEAGGLCLHSINVFKRLKKLAIEHFGEEHTNLETVAICALFHDVCKCCFYKTDYRNVKENGEWVQKPYYTIDDPLPYGHGEKSVYIINGYMRLSREEALAIKQETHFLNIFAVQFCLHRNLKFIASIDLRPAGEAGQNIISTIFIAFFNQIVLIPKRRSRANDGHLAQKDVENLRQFIKTCLS